MSRLARRKGFKGRLKWKESGRRGDTVRDRVIRAPPGARNFSKCWLRRPVGFGFLVQVERAPRGARHASDL